ncbi:aspartate kinase [Nanchangia anserum]|uniref:aspartate kinase n=1 Tax=Nanchangia anserum TaxID=2692125 RepID=UPI0018839832|nr:aspartate kinase [Nanchangia anserum]QOX81606.1 aspartate kinase [Nanchangia anserum]
MALIVQKFGGSSVSDTDALKRVAQRVVDAHRLGHEVVVVVSAMGDTTDDLVDMATELNPDAPKREMDMLLSAGERISMSLLAMAITKLGVPAYAYTGRQAGIHTDTRYGKASITGMVPERVARALKLGSVAIVAGFQGVNDNGDVTTLGRGGSDTTAVALAAALHADVCEIYTDVDGLFTADPRIVPLARQVRRLDYQETLELAANGAKILHLRAVEFARRYKVALHVRSSFSNKPGTWIADCDPSPRLTGYLASECFTTKETEMEQPIISGIAHDRSQEKITVVGLPDQPGTAAELFRQVAKADANIDMIVQNIAASTPGRSTITFTCQSGDAKDVLARLEEARDVLDYREIVYNPDIGKLSLVGAAMRTSPGISARFFDALSKANVNVEMISTSEVRISVIVDADRLDEAVRALHHEFQLDASETEAVVYGGTGR